MSRHIVALDMLDMNSKKTMVTIVNSHDYNKVWSSKKKIQANVWISLSNLQNFLRYKSQIFEAEIIYNWTLD